MYLNAFNGEVSHAFVTEATGITLREGMQKANKVLSIFLVYQFGCLVLIRYSPNVKKYWGLPGHDITYGTTMSTDLTTYANKVEYHLPITSKNSYHYCAIVHDGFDSFFIRWGFAYPLLFLDKLRYTYRFDTFSINEVPKELIVMKEEPKPQLTWTRSVWFWVDVKSHTKSTFRSSSWAGLKEFYFVS